MIYDEIKLDSHEHKLKLVCSKTPYMCDGCKQIGFGSRYRCEACNYDLHKDCAFAARRISHPFFKKCDFHLFTKGAPPGHGGDSARICHACGSDVQGFFYHCMECKRELHPGCASLPRSIGSDEVRLELRPKVSSKCHRCGWKERRKELKSWSYVSTCGGYCFHVSCVKELILARWEKARFGNLGLDHDEGDEDGESNCSTTALALENAASGSGLQVAVRNNVGSGGTLGRYWRILKMALKFVISVIVGDPTGAVGGLITSLFSP